MMLETDMSGPLAGIRVIDLTVAVLGPVATQILGDLGAEIIKIEPPEGEMMRGIGPARNPGMAAYYLNVNRNKCRPRPETTAGARRVTAPRGHRGCLCP